MPQEERVLVTGGQGFIGAWIVKQLLEEDSVPIILDLKPADGILKQVLTPEQLAGLEIHYADISNTETVKEIVKKTKPTSVIHLAGLQIPTCKVNPILGAQVNIIGTLNVFEAVKEYCDENSLKPLPIAYASSAAVIGPEEDYNAEDAPLKDDFFHKPATIYGVYKLCGEGCARIYWQEHQMPSVGIRPLTCFGVGREIGLTSSPTKAIKSVVLGRKYEVTFTGKTGFSYVKDVARVFIGSTRAELKDAYAFNLRGIVTTSEDFVEILKKTLPEAADLITLKGPIIPIMSEVDESGLVSLLRTVPKPYDLQEPFPMPLADCIEETALLFKTLAQEGRLHDDDLPPQ